MSNDAERRWFGRWEKALLFIFLLTLPLVNPWVRGDGVGYYAYARAPLVQGNFRFEQDWLRANSSFVMGRVDPQGHILPDQYTSTGHLVNHFSAGPAILWFPFLAVTHFAVRVADFFGAHIPADGFSEPYLVTMAVSTALYGFLGIVLAFRLARKYIAERWAFWGALGIWFASSLPVYMYFNPSWSHAHSAFAVALFLWYWDRTRGNRSLGQWAALGALSGLMVDVYYPNAILLVIPFLESLGAYVSARRAAGRFLLWGSLFAGNVVYAAAALFALLPTFVTRQIVFGSPFASGYNEMWSWISPFMGKVLFSSDHGLFTWTPVAIVSFAGIILLARKDKSLSLLLLAAFCGYVYFIGCYGNWAGIASFGNRFFVSLTAIFVIGLACALDALSKAWTNLRIGGACARGVTLLLIAWNIGFIFQWGMHLVPPRGPISWPEMIHNQVFVVPSQAGRSVAQYFAGRNKLMRKIEGVDVEQLKKSENENHHEEGTGK